MAKARTLENLMADLRRRHDVLAEQIAALELPCENRSHTLLVHYLVTRSSKTTSDWANAQGWHLPGAKGPRQYQANDVLALIETPAEPVPAALQAMASEMVEKNRALVARRFD